MTDWLLQQQVVLSVAIIFLMLIVRFLIPALGAGRAYQLWLLVPVVLIAHNLPASAVSLPAGPVSRYVTGTGSLIASPAGNTFLFIATWLWPGTSQTNTVQQVCIQDTTWSVPPFQRHCCSGYSVRR